MLRGSESEADANDESRETRELRGDNHQPAIDRKAPRFADTLRKQFRELVKALTQPAPEPQPQPRTRRSGKGETGRAFGPAARKMTRRLSVRSLIVHAAEFVWDTMDWLHLWDGNHPASMNEDYHDCQPTDNEHLSLHL